MYNYLCYSNMLPQMAFQFPGSQKKHFLYNIVTKDIDKHNKN